MRLSNRFVTEILGPDKMASTSTSTSTSENTPVSSVEENRSRLCEEFASIAGTDRAVAQCYLAENEWEMEVLWLYPPTIFSCEFA